METFAALLTSGDPCSLVVSVVALVLGALLLRLAAHVRPRSRRRAAR